MRPARRKLFARLAVPLLAVALLLAGLILITLPVRAENFGWFAYAPLSQQTFQVQGLMLIGTEAWAGIVMISVGLLILAFWTGYRVGRSSAQRLKG
ncbi:hypothetical protein ACQCSU_08335 [Pseudarthrobacter sp. O4]|uniref:hypothetical protein n=1 Tax=Pseudarthrobacter sp. O4 TaxID=3418417 RepID=UPI003CF09471